MEWRRIYYSSIGFIFLIFVGSLSFRVVEGPQWSFTDGLFMTIITLFTVGYSEVHPLTDSGKILSIIIILLGAGLMTYIASLFAQLIFEGKLKEIWGLKRMMERIAKLENHYIICGAGKTASEIIKSLSRTDSGNFVVIDTNRERILKLIDNNILAFQGDATHDNTLLDAGLNKATALVTTLPTDADNVFVTLTAKGINNDIRIVSKAEKVESIAKLRRAGASKVVSPNIIAGARMAAVIRKPSVVDFMEAAMAGDNQAMQIEEFRVQNGSYLEGKALKDAGIREKSGAIIVAAKSENKTTINPEPGYIFTVSDTLMVFGTKEQIEKFSSLTK